MDWGLPFGACPPSCLEGVLFFACQIKLWAVKSCKKKERKKKRNAGLDEAQVGIKIAGRNINNLRYAVDTTLMAESEELKSLLMKGKEESEKVGLRLNIQKAKIMASSPITSWQMDGETVETVADFFDGAPKSLQRVTAAMNLKDASSLEGKLWPT